MPLSVSLRTHLVQHGCPAGYATPNDGALLLPRQHRGPATAASAPTPPAAATLTPSDPSPRASRVVPSRRLQWREGRRRCCWRLQCGHGRKNGRLLASSGWAPARWVKDKSNCLALISSASGGTLLEMHFCLTHPHVPSFLTPYLIAPRTICYNLQTRYLVPMSRSQLTRCQGHSET